MGRLTNRERDKKMLEAEDMYIRGSSVQTISDIIDISVDSINKWKRDGEWDEKAKNSNIDISNIKKEILNTFQSMKDGEKPAFTPDEITKLASAWEKVNDKQKNLAYMYQNFADLTDAMVHDIAKAKSKKVKEAMMENLKYVRKKMQEVTDKAYKEALND